MSVISLFRSHDRDRPRPLPMTESCFVAITAAATSAAAVASETSHTVAPSSSGSARGAHRATKSLSFGRVVTIGDVAVVSDVQNSMPQHTPAHEMVRHEQVDLVSATARKRPSLRRSPTPLVHSLAELAEEHRDQLCVVWNEPSTHVPDINADKQDIANSMLELGVPL